MPQFVLSYYEWIVYFNDRFWWIIWFPTTFAKHHGRPSERGNVFLAKQPKDNMARRWPNFLGLLLSADLSFKANAFQNTCLHLPNRARDAKTVRKVDRPCPFQMLAGITVKQKHVRWRRGAQFLILRLSRLANSNFKVLKRRIMETSIPREFHSHRQHPESGFAMYRCSQWSLPDEPRM